MSEWKIHQLIAATQKAIYQMGRLRGARSAAGFAAGNTRQHRRYSLTHSGACVYVCVHDMLVDVCCVVSWPTTSNDPRQAGVSVVACCRPDDKSSRQHLRPGRPCVQHPPKRVCVCVCVVNRHETYERTQKKTDVCVCNERGQFEMVIYVWQPCV